MTRSKKHHNYIQSFVARLNRAHNWSMICSASKLICNRDTVHRHVAVNGY